MLFNRNDDLFARVLFSVISIVLITMGMMYFAKIYSLRPSQEAPSESTK